MIISEYFVIEADYENSRIDRWLKNKVYKFHQSFIEKSLRSGKIKVNKKKVKSSYKLQIGDNVAINIDYEKQEENKKFSYQASMYEYKEIKNNIIFENKDYMILNKPAGIAVQSGSKSPKNIIDILNKFSDEKKFYLVHRIDKETSGLIILACNRTFAQILSEQFRNKVVKKNYLAILYGCLPVNEGTLDHNLTFKDKSKVKTFKAETDFFVLSKNKDFSYVQANPITGRKHQLRRQFFHINHPIVGDDKYFIPHYKNNNKYLMLHSHEVIFEYLGKKKTYKIEAPFQFKVFLKESGL